MIREKLLAEIEAYCKLNEIEDVELLVNKMLLQGFTIEKFGLTPPGFKPQEEIVIKNVDIVEPVVEEKVEEPTEDEEVKEEVQTANVYNITIEEKKEEEKKKTLPPPDDLYGEGKGFWGSNLLD